MDVSAMLWKVITSDDEREERGCERNVVEFRQRWCLCVCLYVCASVVVSHSWDRMTQAIQVASSSDALFHSSDSQL